MKRFRTVMADPPWPERGGGRIRRGANRHYKTMTVRQIKALDVQSLAMANAHLYLWTTNNFLPDALEVMAAWGFRYVTMVTWTKDKIGLGQYFRGRTEHCLFGVRGIIPYRIVGGKRQQGTTWIHGDYRGHSTKPRAIREMVERVSKGPYLELFARERTPRWAVWGNQVRSDVKIGRRAE